MLTKYEQLLITTIKPNPLINSINRNPQPYPKRQIPSPYPKMSLLFQKPQHMQKLRYNFDQYSSDGKNLIGIKTIKSYFSSIGLNNQLFYNDLVYFFPDLQRQQKQQEFKMPFEDCLALVDFLVSKKNSSKLNDELLESFKLFDKNSNGVINTGDLLANMKKYLSPKEFQQFSQIITSSFGLTINYLDAFKFTPVGKNH